MANREHLIVFYKGVAEWNVWRLENPDEENIDLSGEDMSYEDLTGINFSNTHLKFVNFTGAILNWADFEFATLNGTIFGNTDLSQVSHLENAHHAGPSTLGIDTIYKSGGNLPVEFLRGCGLSDLQIEISSLAYPKFPPSLVTDITYRIHELYLGDGIKYYSCFISYSSADQIFAERLYSDLQNNGVRCWFAPEDLKIGDLIRPKIDQEIRLRDRFLIILSENALKSNWVSAEVEAALDDENRSNRKILFPIRLDNSVMDIHDGWAAKIKRSRHIGDFSNWKDKATYQKVFERLLQDLKASGEVGNGE
jgi:hypothetical protein